MIPNKHNRPKVRALGRDGGTKFSPAHALPARPRSPTKGTAREEIAALRHEDTQAREGSARGVSRRFDEILAVVGDLDEIWGPRAAGLDCGVEG